MLGSTLCVALHYGASQASAQEATSTTALPATTTELSTSTATSTSPTPDELFQKDLSQHRAAFALKTQERIYHLLQNIMGRTDAALFRLSDIAHRLESRKAKLEQEGIPTGDAGEHLAKAQEALFVVRRILTLDLASFVRAENARERFVTVRMHVKEAKASLFDAQTELHAALNALSQATQPPLQPSASSTQTH